MASQPARHILEDTEMASSTPIALTPIALDSVMISPGTDYDTIYSEALGDGPRAAGRILLIPLTFFEARRQLLTFAQLREG